MNDDVTDVLAVLDSLPTTLRTVRILRGRSLRQAAREMGLSASTVLRIEKGDDAALSNVRACLGWIRSEEPR